MISWIQRTFQQHFKWLFLILLGVVIISFVFITNASSGFGHSAKQAPARPFFGLNLSSPEDTQSLVRDASISASLHGLPIRSEDQFQQYALQRQAALHLADQLHLPPPTAEDLARHVQTLGMFTGADGKFDPKRYADFRDSLKTNPQLTEGDVTRVLSDDVIYQQVLKLLSGPGYILPVDVKQQLTRIDSLWTIEAVVIDYESFKPAITPTDEELAAYFEFNAARYQVPAKVGISYIDFPASAYADQVPASEEGLRAYYEANAARFAPPGGDKPATPDAAFAAVRKQVEDAYKLERARPLANAAASDISVTLFNEKINAGTLPAFIAGRQLTLKRVSPFTSREVPAELGSNPQVAAEAFKINSNRLFSDPVDTGRGAAILVWNESIPARQPDLAEVRDRVTADYLETEKRKRFVDAGRTLRAALETRLKAGDTLAKAVEASSGAIPAKLTTKSWPAFTLATPPQDIDYSVYGAIDGLKKGELSQMVASIEQGYIVYAAEKKTPNIDPASEKFTQTRERLAVGTASRNGSEYLARLVEQELSKSAPITQ